MIVALITAFIVGWGLGRARKRLMQVAAEAMALPSDDPEAVDKLNALRIEIAGWRIYTFVATGASLYLLIRALVS